MDLYEAMQVSEQALEDETLIKPVNDVLEINPEIRQITIPETEKLFGAKSDKDVERKYFKCPKIVGDNIDLSKHIIYVIYQKSNEDATSVVGNVGKYLCEDVKVEGEYITFSWLLSRKVLEEQGFIAFKIMAVNADIETGEVKTVWNTIPSVGAVKFTLEDGDEIEQIYSDIITQLVERMNRIEGVDYKLKYDNNTRSVYI